MTLQVEEADASKLRERLDAEALNYKKLRESVFAHNVGLRASTRIPMGVALDAEVCLRPIHDYCIVLYCIVLYCRLRGVAHFVSLSATASPSICCLGPYVLHRAHVTRS